METLVKICQRSCQEAYTKVDTALKDEGIEFSREGHKYSIPNFPHCYGRVVSIASRALRDTQFHATEIPYREVRDQRPRFMAVLHLDDESYTFC